MRKFLNSLEVKGSFNFITYFITLNRKPNLKKDITNILEQDYNFNKKFQSPFEENIYCTIFHEITHFLDLTTTFWGLEYSYRKLNVIKNNFDERTIDVFKLNVAEIEIFHDSKFSWKKEIDFYNCILTHSPTYDKRWGAFIVINIFKNSMNFNNLIAQIPINMLTILETNAIATEYLIKLKYSTQFPNIIEKEFNDFINNPQYIEYNILLLLLKKGFDFLTFEKLLIFIKYLIKICLNLGMISLSSLANKIEQSFNNKIIGNTITMELRRGMSRDVLIFKLILIFHSMVEQNNNLKEELSTNPKKFIYNFFNDHIKQNIMEMKMLQELTNDINNIFNYKLNNQSFLKNYSLLQKNIESDYLLKDFVLPDILLEDQETIISFPKRIDFDIIDFFDQNIDKITKLEDNLKKDMYKFHMDISTSNINIF